LLQVDLVRPDALSAAERSAWAAFQAQTPEFASPLLSHGFAELVGGVRDDLVVAVARAAGEVVGFLPHHRRPFRFGRPVGAPFSDYHAFVSRPDPGVTAEALLAGAGLTSFRFTGLIDPYGVFTHGVTERGPSHQIAFAGEGADYLEALRAGSPKRFKNLRRLVHKLEREVGELTLAPNRDAADFAALIAWKRQQLQRTGLHDVLGSAWTQELMQAAFARAGDELSGLFLGLKIGDRLVAGHFGVRQGDRYHPWIAAHDPALSAYSPGVVFLWKAIEAMRGLGLSVYDLSGGHDHYKRPFASGYVEIAAGMAGRSRPAATSAPLARLQRRMDQIAAVELSLGGRLQGLATAVAAQGRRKADLERIGGSNDE
jgi:CelD/BcsL family acetyltransferase involved in cellulose biosynthesis